MASIAGFMHPLLGLDHLLAMIALGLWAALLGGRALWLLPVTFVVCTMGGFAMAVAGLGLPGVEAGTATSVAVLGLLITVAARLPLAACVVLAGLFAVFHGHAHGTELIGTASSFGIGFAAATALLHLAGIALARASGAARRRIAVRSLGGAVAAAGLALLGGWA